jgi:hypothetical protein
MGMFLSVLDGLSFIVARNVAEHLRQINRPVASTHPLEIVLVVGEYVADRMAYEGGFVGHFHLVEYVGLVSDTGRRLDSGQSIPVMRD